MLVALMALLSAHGKGCSYLKEPVIHRWGPTQSSDSEKLLIKIHIYVSIIEGR